MINPLTPEQMEEMRQKCYAFNRSVRDKDEQITSLQTQLNERLREITEQTETMRTIANGFSNTVWNLLPSRIKEHFEEYRE